jgi:hypothetical protein
MVKHKTKKLRNIASVVDFFFIGPKGWLPVNLKRKPGLPSILIASSLSTVLSMLKQRSIGSYPLPFLTSLEAPFVSRNRSKRLFFELSTYFIAKWTAVSPPSPLSSVLFF